MISGPRVFNCIPKSIREKVYHVDLETFKTVLDCWLEVIDDQPLTHDEQPEATLEDGSSSNSLIAWSRKKSDLFVNFNLVTT